MFYLIEYDRNQCVTTLMRVFNRQSLLDAQNASLQREVENHANHIEREVALLDAANEHDLQITHSRYFS